MELRVREAAARRRRYFRLVLLALALVLLGSALFSFWVGYYPLTPDQVVKAFLSRFGWEGELPDQAVTIFWKIRLPRILSALFIGASLSDSRFSKRSAGLMSLGLRGLVKCFASAPGGSCVNSSTGSSSPGGTAPPYHSRMCESGHIPIKTKRILSATKV